MGGRPDDRCAKRNLTDNIYKIFSFLLQTKSKNNNINDNRIVMLMNHLAQPFNKPSVSNSCDKTRFFPSRVCCV